jgi:hypothetical protein
VQQEAGQVVAGPTLPLGPSRSLPVKSNPSMIVHCAAGAAALLRVAVAATSSTSAETLVSKRLMERCSRA